jgi:MarR family transcriptional regulator, 2-MHQ and catechol-resistance regulon repressor
LRWGEQEGEALRLWLALARAYHTMSRIAGGMLTHRGITIAQFGVLEALYNLGPLSLGELAGKLLVTGGNITYVMDRMESLGLVTRHRTPEDRRVVIADLTPKGREVISTAFPEYARFVLVRVEHLEVEERAELRRLLKKLGRALAAEEAAGPGGGKKELDDPGVHEEG